MNFRNIFFDEGDGGCTEPDEQAIVAGDRVIERSRECTVAAENLSMVQSAACVVAGDSVMMQESASWMVIADEVEARNSRAVIVLADEMRGDFSTVFTPKTAAIFGATCGLAFFLLSRIFGRCKR
jgi:hypothetical protein